MKYSGVISLVVVALAVVAPARAQERPGTTTGTSPCQQTYDETQHQIVEARTLNDAAYRKAKIDCKGNQSCIRSVQQAYVEGQREIAKRQVDASAQFDVCRQRLSAASNKAGLPHGAVASGDPDAPDAGVPGFLGSFPGTRSKWGSFCYTYLCERNVWNVNPLPTKNPHAVGHDQPAAGDVALVYRKLRNSDEYLPVHFAVYQGNGVFYQRNGASSIEVINSQFFSNYPNAVVRYVNRDTGK